MAKTITDSQHYASIAAAIRAKNGKTTTYKPSEMALAIAKITNTEQGTEKTTAFVDFTNFYSGSFTETFSDGSIVTHTVAFDADRNPIMVDDISVTGIISGVVEV